MLVADRLGALGGGLVVEAAWVGAVNRDGLSSFGAVNRDGLSSFGRLGAPDAPQNPLEGGYGDVVVPVAASVVNQGVGGNVTPSAAAVASKTRRSEHGIAHVITMKQVAAFIGAEVREITVEATGVIAALVARLMVVGRLGPF